MNLSAMLETLAALRAKAASAGAPRFSWVLAGELAAISSLLWTADRRPRLNLAVAAAAYLIVRYRSSWFGPASRSTPR